MTQRNIEDLLRDCESPIERLMVEALYRQVTEQTESTLDVQTEILGGRYRADITISGAHLRLAVECDGEMFHATSPDQVARDRERDRAFQMEGWVVFRFSGKEITNFAGWCASEVMRLLHGRGATAPNYQYVATQRPPLVKDDGDLRLLCLDKMLESAANRSLTFTPPKNLITTGHYQIDNDTGGFEKECVWFIGADTSWGKSSHAIMVADENLKRGNRPLIVSWEDSDKLYADRILMRRAKIRPAAFKWHRKGRLELNSEEMTRMNAVVQAANHIPLFLDARGKSVEWVAQQVISMVKSYEIDLVLVDYIQAADNEKKQQDRRNQVDW